MAGLIIGILSQFVPDILLVAGIPFAFLYIISSIVILIIYSIIIKN